MGTYLKYTKQILTKMSFCSGLLNKEYKKCLALLSHREIGLLKKWISKQKFKHELS
jgi:hypothetical protein